jgi:hypothetical protein
LPHDAVQVANHADPFNIRRSEPKAVFSPSSNLLIDLRRMFSRLEGKG